MENDRNKRIGDRLKQLRGNEKQWFIASLLKGRKKKDGSAKMTESGYNLIEKGKTTLSTENAARLAKYYGVDVAYILCETDYMSQKDRFITEHHYSAIVSASKTRYLESLGISTGGFIWFDPDDEEKKHPKDRVYIDGKEFHILVEDWKKIKKMLDEIVKSSLISAATLFSDGYSEDQAGHPKENTVKDVLGSDFINPYTMTSHGILQDDDGNPYD